MGGVARASIEDLARERVGLAPARDRPWLPCTGDAGGLVATTCAGAGAGRSRLAGGDVEARLAARAANARPARPISSHGIR